MCGVQIVPHTKKEECKLSVYQGDFLGFSLGDRHSYNLNITRISTNDRYQDNLIPSFNDATTQVPGGDGTYYWDTYYTQKQFTIDFAFDDLCDEDLRDLRQLFSFKGVQPFILDELPYKKYMVKCTQSPTLKYLCFDHMEFRIYKGEGNVQLTAYYPFAFSVHSPLLDYNSGGAVVNNQGDLPANINIIYKLSEIENNIIITLKQTAGGPNIGYLKLENIEAIVDNNGVPDVYMMIDTQTQLIEGLDENQKKTGHLYNKYITQGDFFYPPVGRSILDSTQPFTSASYTPLFY